MRVLRVTCWVVALLGTASCGKEIADGQDGTVGGEIRLAPNGFVCVLSPSEAYAPGYIYRLDSDGAQWLASDLSSAARVNRYEAALGTYSATAIRDFDLTFSLLGAIGAVTGGNATGSNDKKDDTTVKFTEGSFGYMDDAASANLITQALNNVSPVPESEYYMVRDVVTAKGITIDLSRKDVSNLGGSAEIRGLVSADPSIKVEDSSTLLIEESFSTPLNVCIRAVKIIPNANSMSAASEGSDWIITNTIASADSVAQIMSKEGKI